MNPDNPLQDMDEISIAEQGIKKGVNWTALHEKYADKDITKTKAMHETAAALMQTYDFCTMKDNDALWIYKEPVYVREGVEFIRTKLQKHLGEHIRKNDIREIIDKIKSQTQIERPDMDEYRRYIAFKNGVYDLEQEQLVEPSPDRFIINQINAEYDPDADKKEVYEFVSSLVKPEDVVVLQEMAGYCMYAGYEHEKAWMLLGEGGNGKTTFLNVLQEVIGDENVANPSLHKLLTNRFASASLHGKLANINGDLGEHALKNTEEFKRLTGGDPVYAERKGENGFSFRNTAKLVYAANQLPMTKDMKDAFFRRWIIVEFPYTFTSQFDDGCKDKDPYIEEKMQEPAYKSTFVNWALKGLKRVLRRDEFSDTGNTEEIKKEWLLRTDPVAAFNEYYVEEAANVVVVKQDLAEAIRQFCDDYGAPFENDANIGKRFQEVNRRVIDKRLTVAGRQVNCWLGVKVFGKYGGNLDHYLKTDNGLKLLSPSKDKNNIKGIKGKKSLIRNEEGSNIIVKNSKTPDRPDSNFTTDLLQRVEGLDEGEGVTLEQLKDEFRNSVDEIVETLDKLADDGVVYEPRPGVWATL